MKNLTAFADICQEFQVDWINDRIKSYLETLKVNGDEKTHQLLVYLRIASKMNFNEAEKNLVNQMSENFVITQTRPEFLSLDTKTKVLVARKRLWLLSMFFERRNEFVLNTFLNDESAGLMSILKDYKQISIEFQLNAEELETIKNRKGK